MPYRLAQGRSIYEFYIGIIKIGSLNGYLYKKPEKVRVRKYNTDVYKRQGQVSMEQQSLFNDSNY